MAKKVSAISVIFVFFSFLGLSIAQNRQLAPALYVFGDSTVDPGNNNGIVTFAKFNYSPYGINFPGGISGRPTNGYIIADFFAESLGLNLPPAFRSVDLTTYNSNEGFNYASSSAGILPDTGTEIYKGIISLGEQIDMFTRTVNEYLTPRFKCQDSLKQHLSKSIFLLIIGSNDYGINLLRKEKKLNQTLDHAAFTINLVEKYALHLQDLYKLGARKFVVFNIEASGCLPVYLKSTNSSKCVDKINAMVSNYNEKLHKKLQVLGSTLQGSTFLIGKNYDFMLNLAQNPADFGLKDAINPCCVVTPFGTCKAKIPPCRDINSYVFFDSLHPTEATYKILAHRCFSGTGTCVPINVQQLTAL